MKNKSSQFKEAWFSNSLGYLEIIDRVTGNQNTFEVYRKINEPRMKYNCPEQDQPLDTEEYFGCNGFKRMRSLENISCELWQTEQMEDISQKIFDMSLDELKNVEDIIAMRKKELEN